ncbi:MAG: IS21 family transposase [Desulfatitalea sp.]|nr:IS21 family transposase [Desulfatitalea sp.]
MAEIREILRCYRITRSKKETARTLKVAKGTVKRYVRWAEAKGYLEADELPSEALLAREWKGRNNDSGVVAASLDVYRDVVQDWIEDGIIVKRIHEMLVERYGWIGSYETLKLYTRPMRVTQGTCVRIEVAPGEEAQVDFGYAGFVWDTVEKRRRKAWVFLMTLSHSRHAYGEFVFRQDTETWISCHRHAFEFFGGVPKKLTIDNLKAAIVKAAIYDPMVNRVYRECAEHYGFLISPCMPGMPEHKGKVERGVPYVRKSFVAGRDFIDIADANIQLIDWLVNKAGLRIHGTTKRKPLEIFNDVEKTALLELPDTPFSKVTWNEALVHRDCHVVVGGSFYSAPHRLRGETLLVRIGDGMVRIFHRHELIASHICAVRQGTRRTLPEHYPPEKAAYMEQSPQWCLERAKSVGKATHRLIEQIFIMQHPLDGLRRAQGILAMSKRYTPCRLEAAAERALHFGTITYQAIKRILEKGLDQQTSFSTRDAEETTLQQRTYIHARPVADFLTTTSDKEEALWN